MRKTLKKAPRKTPTRARRRVNLELDAAPGSHVFVAGSFNQWNPQAKPLKPAGGNGHFQATLMLPEGRYEYKFVVDGNWLLDTANAERVPNDQGSMNNVLLVH